MPSIALTGATSMLGIALVHQCIACNVSVIAFVRPGTKRFDRLPKSELVTIVRCDLDSLENVNVECLHADVFYHIGWSFTDKFGRNLPVLQEKNIKYTLDAVNLAKRLGSSRFIGIGSQAEYGRVDAIITPDSPVNPEVSYGIAKYAAGKLSKIECEQQGLDHIWVRVFSVYGKNDNDGTLIKTFIQKIKANESMPLTKCEQIWDYLNESDAGAALYLLGEKGISGKTYCLGSGIAKPLLDYLVCVRDIINKNYQLGIGQLSYSKDQPMHLCADITELMYDTGWKPQISFEEGINLLI